MNFFLFFLFVCDLTTRRVKSILVIIWFDHKNDEYEVIQSFIINIFMFEKIKHSTSVSALMLLKFPLLQQQRPIQQFSNEQKLFWRMLKMHQRLEYQWLIFKENFYTALFSFNENWNIFLVQHTLLIANHQQHFRKGDYIYNRFLIATSCTVQFVCWLKTWNVVSNLTFNYIMLLY